MNCPNCNADDLKQTGCEATVCPQNVCRECEWGCDIDIPYGRCASSLGEQKIPDDWDPGIGSAVQTVVDSLTASWAGERTVVVRRGEREPISPFVRRAVFMRDGFRCQNCSSDVSRELAHLDHIIPWSAGGSDRSDNLRVLCVICNENRSNFRGGLDHQRVLPVATSCRRCYPDRVDLETEIPAWCATCRQPSVSDPRSCR